MSTINLGEDPVFDPADPAIIDQDDADGRLIAQWMRERVVPVVSINPDNPGDFAMMLMKDRGVPLEERATAYAAGTDAMVAAIRAARRRAGAADRPLAGEEAMEDTRRAANRASAATTEALLAAAAPINNQGGGRRRKSRRQSRRSRRRRSSHRR